MDIEAKRRELRSILMNPANGYMMSEQDVPLYRTSIQYIDLLKVVRNHTVFQGLKDVLLWEASAIKKTTNYNRIIAVDDCAAIFAQAISEITAEVRVDLSKVYRHGADKSSLDDMQSKNLQGSRCLILTDFVASGQQARLTDAYLKKLGAIPTAVLSVLNATDSTTLPTESGEVLPIRSAVSIELDGFSSKPEALYSSELDLQKAVPIITSIDEVFVKYFARHPKELYNINPRTFEKLVTHILRDFGYDVELTKATRDGGTDIIAHIRTALTSFLVQIECKRYSAENKVGVDIVRSVLGVQELTGASKSIIVTTSYFTKDATITAQKIEHRLELKDYSDLKAWLARYA